LLVLLTLVTAATGAAVFSTRIGQVALVDQWERTALAFGQPVNAAEYETLRAWSRQGPLVAAGNAVLGLPGLVLGASFLAFLWLRRAAPQVRYGQVLAVTVHTAVILALGRLVAAPLVYATETTASATTVGAWFPGLDEASPVARFLGAIDLFTLWWVVVLGIGLAVLSGRRARTCAFWTAALYVMVALFTAGVMAVAAQAASGPG
jgi:hypothetical protein